MQSPSSLIFILLLGIWAAYFVQYWVRRRDHLSTARSVDQFSAAMRVLERRDAVAANTPDVPGHAAPRAYPVHAARAAGSPVVTERVAPVRARRPQVRPSRRVRGITLLATAAALLTCVPLVVLAVLPVWALGAAFVLLGASLAWVRAGARAQASLTRAHRRRQAELARLRTSAPVTAPVARRGATASWSRTGATASEVSVTATASDHPVATSAPASPAVDPVEAPAAVSAPPVEVAPVATPVTAPAAEVMVPIVDEDDIPLTWDPVPVPRPTYTMKAMAPRAEVEPAEVTPTPAPVERRSESGDPAYDGRQAAGA